MEFVPSGYSEIQFNTKRLRSTAKCISEYLPTLMEKTGAQAVIVTGKSGISMAFATLMLIDFPLVVVRKENETSHGYRVEGTSNVDITKYLILDDFVESGSTVRNIAESIDSYYMTTQFLHRNKGLVGAECVGVVAYYNIHGCTDLKEVACFALGRDKPPIPLFRLPS